MNPHYTRQLLGLDWSNDETLPWSNDETLPWSNDAASSLRGGDPTLVRLLNEQRHTKDGSLAILMIVLGLFCFIWAPLLIRRCRAHSQYPEGEDVHELARFEAEARAVRATLQRMSMINSVLGERYNERCDPRLEHRKEFLDNALLTKKVIFQRDGEANDKENIEAATTEDEEVSNDSSNPSDRNVPQRQKGNVIVLVNTTKCKKDSNHTAPSPLKDDGTTTDTEEKVLEKTESMEDNDPQVIPTSPLSNSDESQQLEPCSICLTEYNDGDEICWSHNDKCNHFFHKACIQTWLLTHEECPCCRRDFLCLWDEEAETNNQSPRPTTIADQSSLDWAEELAEEIQQRIFQRQRQLQAELERRDREQQQSQQPLHSASFPTTSPNSRTQPGFATRNTVISVDDMAAGFLLYRHFPLQFASDPRRLTLGHLDLDRVEDGGDVEVAHFGLPLHGSWQASRTGQTAGGVNSSTASVFDFIDRSSRQRRLSPGEHQPSRFFSTATGTVDSTTSRRFFGMASSRSASNSPSGSNISEDRATAENATSDQTNAATISRRFFRGGSAHSTSNSPSGGNIATSSENPTAEESSNIVASSGSDDSEIVTYTA